jgi:folylpolyglutamate synthase/dihydropteroate synthase
MRKQSVSPIKLAEYCDEYGFDQWEIIKDVKQAYKALLAREEDILVVTGSFYLLNHTRKIMKLKPGHEQHP